MPIFRTKSRPRRPHLINLASIKVPEYRTTPFPNTTNTKESTMPITSTSTMPKSKAKPATKAAKRQIDRIDLKGKPARFVDDDHDDLKAKVARLKKDNEVLQSSWEAAMKVERIVSEDRRRLEAKLKQLPDPKYNCPGCQDTRLVREDRVCADGKKVTVEGRCPHCVDPNEARRLQAEAAASGEPQGHWCRMTPEDALAYFQELVLGKDGAELTITVKNGIYDLHMRGSIQSVMEKVGEMLKGIVQGIGIANTSQSGDAQEQARAFESAMKEQVEAAQGISDAFLKRDDITINCTCGQAIKAPLMEWKSCPKCRKQWRAGVGGFDFQAARQGKRSARAVKGGRQPKEKIGKIQDHPVWQRAVKNQKKHSAERAAKGIVP
jgi:hypothetical protein